MIRLGDKVSFIPIVIKPESGTRYAPPPPVEGVVVEIHPKHKYFRARYEVKGNALYECFKFCEIGTAVTVIGK